MKVTKPKHQSRRKDAVRHYTTQHVPGTHLDFTNRQTLASDRNATIRAGRRITLRQFAAKHGLRDETWRREYLRGATGAAVPDPKSRRYVIEKLEHVRRWYPKGTDFGKCTTADMHRLERVINSIHRKLLDGLTAYQYDAAHARAA